MSLSAPVVRPPTGTVTFLFTDIEGSTGLLRRLGPGYADVLAEHRRLLREAFAAAGGYEVDTQGDGFFVAFPSPRAAVVAAVAAQRGLAGHPWPGGEQVRVRMGLHTGEATSTESGYIGLSVHQAARVAAAAHGGQVLLSDATAGLLADVLPDGVTLHPLGVHAVRDFPRPLPLAQLDVAGLPTGFPPPRTGTRFPPLPAAAGPLVGRDDDLAAVVARLRDAGTRMLTLTGPGGVGKTTLALAAARAVADDLPGGVAFVPLSTVTDPDQVLGAVAGALGIRREPGVDPVAALRAGLGRERVLLLLDNVEQVAAAGGLLTALLDAVPGLVLLVTSRVLLRLRAERQHPVGPLAVDDAVALFAERARAVDPSFDPDADADVVAAICRRLDGLPLAVELAAARVRLLGARALHDRLGDCLDAFGRGPADLPERQRTLRAAMDWSFGLLPPHEQQLLTRLGVFSGGWTLDVAEQVCGRDGEPDVVETMFGLLDASLVRRSSAAGPEPRMTMLETVRAYAAERLARSPDREETARRHTAWVLGLTDPATTGEARAFRAALDVFDREHDNIRTAVQRALDDRDAATAALLIRNCLPFLSRRDHERQVLRWVEQAGPLAEGAPDEVRARLLVLRALLSGMFAGAAGVHALLDEAVPLLPDDAAHSYDLALAAMARFYGAAAGRDADRAARALTEACDRFRAGRLDLGLAFMEMHSGDLDLATGRQDQADAHYAASVELAVRMGDDALAGQVLCLRGLALLARGEPAKARRALVDGAAATRRGGQPTGMAHALEGLAAVALAEGRPDLATTPLAAAAAAREHSAVPTSPVLAQVVALLEGSVRAAVGDEAWAAARADARTRPVHEALDRALAELAGT